MNGLAQRFVDYLIENHITSPEMRQEHIYGFEVLFGKILNYGTLLLLSIIDHNIIGTLFFMISFFTLRGRTGGYHAPRASVCYLGSILIYICVSRVMAPFLSGNTYALLGIMGISVVIIFLTAPVNHPNLCLDEKEIQLCKSSSRRLAIVISLSVCLFVWLEAVPIYTAYVVAGMGMDAGLLIFAKIIKQEV